MDNPVIPSEPVCFPDRVVTRVHLAARPQAVWQRLMFFEDVPRGPWSILRWALPRPLRSEGDKSTIGSIVRCVYEGGHLIKEITAVHPGHLLRFAVVEQQLGVEKSFRAHEGSYELREVAGGTEVVLTTHYRGTRRPRFLWRSVETYFGHRLHHYILRGMREALRGHDQLGARATPDARDEASTVAIPRR